MLHYSVEVQFTMESFKAILGDFAPQCYYYHPEYVSERNNLTLGHNLTYAFAQCDNISPDKFAKYCYQGIGRLLQPIAYTNTEQAIAACYRGNQPIVKIV